MNEASPTLSEWQMILEISNHLTNVKNSERDKTYLHVSQVSYILKRDAYCIISFKNGSQIKVKREEGQKILDAWAPKVRRFSAKLHVSNHVPPVGPRVSGESGGQGGLQHNVIPTSPSNESFVGRSCPTYNNETPTHLSI